ncbi:MAG TPA: hypothetical protein VL651_12170 [Bacteroidia bacterium]|jgi:YD repeat-containing protein|nr:hypothetical protein [Bacteroidia bacterium]
MKLRINEALLFFISLSFFSGIGAQIPKTPVVDPMYEYRAGNFRNTEPFVAKYHAHELRKTSYSFYIAGRDTTISERGITELAVYDSTGRMLEDSGQFITFYLYNEQGQLIKRFNRKKTELFTYDPSGKIIEYDMQHDNYTATKTYYYYDTGGNLLSQDTYIFLSNYSGAGEQFDSSRYEGAKYVYDANGRVISKQSYLITPTKDTSFSYYVYTYTSTGTTITDRSKKSCGSYVSFNSKGDPVELYLCSDGRISDSTKLTYQYSEKGDLTRIVDANNDGTFSTTYVYDNSGMLIRIITNSKGSFREEIFNWTLF